jgi:1,4-dihydroxy-2-naphthoate octaprenyltransferase
MDTIRLFIRLTRPLFLLGAALLYALGAGIAHYLGENINWTIYISGQLWVSLLQLSTHYLNEYYDTPGDLQNNNRTPLTGGSGALGPGRLLRRIALIAGLACLAALASITVLFIAWINPTPLVYLIMLLGFLGAFFYSVPPIRLESSGYGELTTTVLLTFLVPAFAFGLQTGELHRLVSMTAFPLASLHLAMFLAFELPDYLADVKSEKKTLMVRVGWHAGMNLHNVLILTSYLLLILAATFGYPWFATWPALLTLPLGVFQIVQMRRIANGSKPQWNILVVGALALFSATVYLITFAFWIN